MSAAPGASLPLPLRLTLRNARQGLAYSERLRVEPAEARVDLLDLSLPPALGLSADLASGQVIGTPLLSGEFTLSVRYRVRGAVPDAVHVASLVLIVNPDPRTLWQDLPSDPHAPYWKPDHAHARVPGGGLQLVAARRRGRSHAHRGLCCDDDFALDADPQQGWFAAVVADGAGSASHSRRGSQLVTTAAAAFLRQTLAGAQGLDLFAAAHVCAEQGATQSQTQTPLTPELRQALVRTLGGAAQAAQAALQAELRGADASDTAAAAVRPASERDLSTTLWISLALRAGPRWICAAYGVGDGVVALYRAGQDVTLLGQPDGGEFAGQTRFLSAADVTPLALEQRVQGVCVDRFTALLAMTDGVSDARFQSPRELGRVSAWDALWHELQPVLAPTPEPDAVVGADVRLLQWLDFWVAGEYDDRTLALLY